MIIKCLSNPLITVGFKNEVSNKCIIEPTLEFAIVQDADRLDAIGAIGKYLSGVLDSV